MTTAAEILAELDARAIRPVIADGKLKLRGPVDRITPELVERVRQHKAALLVHLTAEQARVEALAVLQRLRTFALPAGRMPAARAIAIRLTGVLARFEADGTPTDDTDDPVEILDALRAIEHAMITMGAAPDPELVKAIATVEQTFPGAQLIRLQ